MNAQRQSEDLTRNQALVFAALDSSNNPMSAYSLLDELRSEGLRAPLQVYRALDKLVEMGMVHRLESLNAFVACSHPQCADNETIAFTICEECGKVSELADAGLAVHLGALARKDDFIARKTTIELRGSCADCQA